MELVIFIGLQGSGKSTFFRTRFASTHEHISKDLFPNNKKPSRRQTQLIEIALQAQHSVVVDNTNPTREERKSIIELGCKYDASVVGYYFESQVSQCRDRNQQRGGKARVPDVAIYSTIKKLEPPAYAEGFHKLFYVRIVSESTFEVSDWIEDEVIDG